MVLCGWNIGRIRSGVEYRQAGLGVEVRLGGVGWIRVAECLEWKTCYQQQGRWPGN